MRKYKTKNDYLLSKYFKDQLLKNHKIKNIKQIHGKTNISNATISRFAKRNGFLNFVDMINKLNSSLRKTEKVNIFKDFLNDIIKSKKQVIIVSSTFTEVVGLLIKQRLMEIGLKVVLYVGTKHIDYPRPRNSHIIFTSISGHFQQYENYLKTKHKNFLLITFFNSYKIENQRLWLLHSNIASDRVDEFNLVFCMYKNIHLIINEIFLKKCNSKI